MGSINIGIMGLGTIGYGVYTILKDEIDKLNKRHNLKLKLHSVADPEIDKKDISGDVNKYNDGYKITNDPDINIVIEVIGGTGIAKELVSQAIKNKKHVITANKAIISEYGKEIFELANENDVTVSFEAAVGGVMPAVHTLNEYLSSNKVISIKGILNGTCNYILTLMEEGLSYEDAVKKAQEKGFAEADPTLDVNGDDTAHKITILARLAWGINIKKEDISYQGIDKLKKIDFDYAKEHGYKIKLIGAAKKLNGKFDIFVKPLLMPKDHLLGKIDHEFNALLVKANYANSVLISGKGAGRFPTATAVVNDVILAAKKIKYKITEKYPVMKDSKEVLPEKDELKSKGYIRVLSHDRQGVLAKEAKILAENNINIKEFFQIAKYKQEDYIPDIIIVDETRLSNINAALVALNKLEDVKGEAFFLGIDE